MNPPRNVPERYWKDGLCFSTTLLFRLGHCPRFNETLDLLQQNTSTIGLSAPQFSRINSRINDLVIFVNKAMKDGFVLKGPSGSHRSDLQIGTESSIYLRLFWKGELRTLLKGIYHLNLENGYWIKYPSNITLDEIVSRINDVTRFALGFYMVAAKSNRLTDLEYL